MLTKECEVFKGNECSHCTRKALITIIEYADDAADINLCTNCAKQLARKLLEDLCAVSWGGRHG
jgi:hypothetical protein